MSKDKKKKQEQDYNPFAITPGQASSPPSPFSNDIPIPASYLEQWEIGRTVEKARADIVEQELTKRKAKLARSQMQDVADYFTNVGQPAIDEIEARIEQAGAQDRSGRQLQKKFLESQLSVLGYHAQHLLDNTLGRLKDIASRDIHTDPEEKPPLPPAKKGFW